MKLKEWAEKTGIKYLTAYRWFKAGTLPINAYQTDSGTIIVEDDPFLKENTIKENTMASPVSNEIMTSFIKKTVEFSKNNSSVEDFAAWILSNFSLRPNAPISESPKYSRNKPKPEEVQNHFKKFLKPKGEKPKINMFVAEGEDYDDLIAQSNNLTAQELANEISQVGAIDGVSVNPTEAPEMEDLMKDLACAIFPKITAPIKIYDDVTSGVINRSFDISPQSITSNNPTDLSTSNVSTSLTESGYSFDVNKASFQPTQKELEDSNRLSQINNKPKRGRKSTNGSKL